MALQLENGRPHHHHQEGMPGHLVVVPSPPPLAVSRFRQPLCLNFEVFLSFSSLSFYPLCPLRLVLSDPTVGRGARDCSSDCARHTGVTFLTVWCMRSCSSWAWRVFSSTPVCLLAVTMQLRPVRLTDRVTAYNYKGLARAPDIFFWLT
uniref:Uncharacterized protein n=1 Tax=Oryza brachyantha TaxID=4533 RepID=J3M0G8_ORYBR